MHPLKHLQELLKEEEDRAFGGGRPPARSSGASPKVRRKKSSGGSPKLAKLKNRRMTPEMRAAEGAAASLSFNIIFSQKRGGTQDKQQLGRIHSPISSNKLSKSPYAQRHSTSTSSFAPRARPTSAPDSRGNSPNRQRGGEAQSPEPVSTTELRMPGTLSPNRRSNKTLDSFAVEAAKQSSYKPSAPDQRNKMDSLSRPKSAPRNKVITDGIAKSEIDWIIFNAKKTPGPGEYDVRASEQALTAKPGKFSESRPQSTLDMAIKAARASPGPGHYDTIGYMDREKKKHGVRFSDARPKSDVDWMIINASKCPGPGQYGDADPYKPSGGRFNLSNPKSDVDWTIHNALQSPGPGQYNAALSDVEAGKGGGRFSTAKPKSDIEWKIIEAAQTPGPGAYATPSIADGKNGGVKFSDSKTKSDLEFRMHLAGKVPGPGAYEVPSLLGAGTGGKFPFVYKPQEKHLMHLTKS